jgi:hypothetical protein
MVSMVALRKMAMAAHRFSVENVAKIIYETNYDMLFEPPCRKGHISLHGSRKEVEVG